MSRKLKLLLCMMFVLGVTASVSAQSLGDVARKERTKQKPQSARTYTNEDIPSAEPPKEEPKPEGTPVVGATDTSADKKDADKDAKAKLDKTAADKQAELNAAWKAKVADAKAQVATLEREINLMQREDRLRTAVYYSDAGNRLRDDKGWAEQEKKYQDDLAARQKDLSDAKQKVDQTIEAARKAGATSVE